MKKHSEFLKHRTVIRTGITEDGGWIFVFEDESHTYFSPDDVIDLVTRTYNLLTKKGE